MSKEKKSEPAVKEVKVPFSEADANGILSIYDMAIKAPGTNVDGLYKAKMFVAKKFQDAFGAK